MPVLAAILSERTARINTAVVTVILFGMTVIAVCFALIMTPDDSPGGGEARHGGGSSSAAGNDSPFTSGSFEGVSPGETELSLERLEDEKERAAAWRELGIEGIQGYVVGENGECFSGALVKATRVRSLDRALPPGEYRTYQATCSEEGWFAFNGIPSGQYSLAAWSGNLAGQASARSASRRSHPQGCARDCEIVLRSSGAVSGRVIGPDGSPVADAWVIPQAMKAALGRTDRQGRFDLKRLEAGRYTITAAAPGFAPESVTSVLTGTDDLEIVLKAGAAIEGRVTLEGKPRSGISVEVDSIVPLKAVTGSDGCYVLAPLERGRHVVSVADERYCSQVNEVHVSIEGERLDGVDFSLLEMGFIKGSVSDKSSGEPIEGAWVRVRRRGGQWYSQRFGNTRVRTDGGGSFVLSSLGPGKYVASVEWAGDHVPAYWENGRTISVEAGRTAGGIDFQLEKGCCAAVEIRDDSGAGITGAAVSVRSADREELFYFSRGRELFPDSFETGEGRYMIKGLRPGVFKISASRRGWIPGSETLAVGPEDRTVSAGLVLDPSFPVSGRVLDPAGTGVGGACVTFGGFRIGSKAITAGDGSFTVSDMSPEKKDATVVARGFATLSRRELAVVKGMDPLEFRLTPEGSHFLAGRVRCDTGKPLTDMCVNVNQSEGENLLSRKAVTDGQGAFRVDGLMSGTAELRIDSNIGLCRQDLRKIEVDRKDVDVTIVRFARIKGRVVDASGAPVESFTARANEESGETIYYGGYWGPFETFSGGVFDIKKVPSGNITVRVNADDGREARSDVIALEPAETVEDVVVVLAAVAALSGKVCDGATGKPVSGAAVHVLGKQDDSFFMRYMRFTEPDSLSGPDGTFEVTGVVPGTKLVMATHPDYQDSQPLELRVFEGQILQGIEIVLGRGGSIGGCITFSGEGKPGVRVSARGSSESPGISFGPGFPGGSEAVSGKGGIFRIDNVPPGKYRLRATIEEEKSSRSMEKRVEVGENQAVSCDFAFMEGGVIEGTVRFLGEPARDINVSARSNPTEKDAAEVLCTGSATSGGDGSYRIDGLPAGTYNVTADHHEWDRGSFHDSTTVVVGTGVTVCDFSIGEGEGCRIDGYLSENGVAMPNARVSCSAGGSHLSERTDASGHFAFTDLPSGTIRISATLRSGGPSSHSRYSSSVILEPGGSIRHDIDFETGQAVLVGCIRRNGEPAGSAFISVRTSGGDDQGKQEWSVFTRNGDFRIEKLAPGRYVIASFEPWLMRQSVEVRNYSSTQVDFDYSTGDADLQGTVRMPEEDEAGRISTYVFRAGACLWKKGALFSEPFPGGGLIAEPSLGRGKGGFVLSGLSADTVDVVAVHVRDSKIASIDVKTVALVDGEKATVELDVSR